VVRLTLQQNPAEEIVDLGTDSAGQLYTKSQFNDYALRGAGLEDFNVLQFFVDTWEGEAKSSPTPALDEANDLHRGPGRKSNQRFPYLSQHPNQGSKIRVLRSPDHNTLPNFIGSRLPRRDDAGIRSLYCASMLLLLKPWRRIEDDLKHPNETWEQAFQSFSNAAPPKTHDVMSNIQYYYECQRSAAESRDTDIYAAVEEAEENSRGDEWDEEVEDVDGDGQGAQVLTEEGLLHLQQSMKPVREVNHGIMAVMHAKHAHIFDDVEQWTPTGNGGVASATGDDMKKLLEWRHLMNEDVNCQQLRSIENSGSVGDEGGDRERGHGHVTALDGQLSASARQGPEVEHLSGDGDEATTEVSLAGLNINELNEEQRRAYEIVLWHAQQTLNGVTDIPPLRMAIHGEGGTGKSRVIQTITKAFELLGVPHKLGKGAYTGIAASLVEGKTLHNFAQINVSGTQEVSAKKKEKLEHFWRDRTYLIIDEHSMLAKAFLARVSRNIAVGKQNGGSTSPYSFGGVNVIICGDFHQFPPVAGEALYRTPDPLKTTTDSELGRSIYEEFDVVVQLKQQMRVVDAVWRDFLRRLRYGRVEKEDLTMLRTLVVSREGSVPTDFSEEKWAKAALITPRHGVRREWNEAAVRQHCTREKRVLFVCPAEDTISGRPLTLAERYGLALRSKRTTGGKMEKMNLSESLSLAIGARVMVTQNVKTDLDLANGARGEIVDIILDAEEEVDSHANGVVYLKKMPAYVLVKMDRTRARQLPGLEEGVIPLEPAMQKMFVNVPQARGQPPVARSVQRRQFAITLAYAFTDYRAQGQTIPTVIVDVATPPSGILIMFILKSTVR
jgi:hypothetical protein